MTKTEKSKNEDPVLSFEAWMVVMDRLIDQWHTGNSALPIHKFLGLSKYEYGLFVTKPSEAYRVVVYRVRNAI